jgi:hypothetical protein
MRNILATFAALIFSASFLFAQDEQVNATATPPPIVKPARDFLMVQFGYTNWINKPDSGIKTKSFAYTFNTYLCYDFPIKKSKFSFATGLGIHTSTTYLDKQRLALSDSGVNGYDASFVTDTFGYKRYKFNTVYLQAPFELRYFSNKYNRNKGFKAAIGIQVGTFLGAHTKGLRSVDGTNIKDKMNTKRYVSPWNFAGTARIGYGNFSIFGSYNITNVFKDNAGPALTPVTVGICLTGL